MTTFVVYLPQTNYRPLPPHASGHPQGCNPQPPSLVWLVLALALGALGVNLAALLIATGLAVATAYSLALLPCCLGLGLTLALFYMEVTLCPAKLWSGV